MNGSSRTRAARRPCAPGGGPQNVGGDADRECVDAAALRDGSQCQTRDRADRLGHPIDEPGLHRTVLGAKARSVVRVEGPSEDPGRVKFAAGQAEDGPGEAGECVVAGEHPCGGEWPAAGGRVHDERLGGPLLALERWVDLPRAEGLLDPDPHGEGHDPLVVAVCADP